MRISSQGFLASLVLHGLLLFLLIYGLPHYLRARSAGEPGPIAIDIVTFTRAPISTPQPPVVQALPAQKQPAPAPWPIPVIPRAAPVPLKPVVAAKPAAPAIQKNWKTNSLVFNGGSGQSTDAYRSENERNAALAAASAGNNDDFSTSSHADECVPVFKISSNFGNAPVMETCAFPGDSYETLYYRMLEACRLTWPHSNCVTSFKSSASRYGRTVQTGCQTPQGNQGQSWWGLCGRMRPLSPTGTEQNDITLFEQYMIRIHQPIAATPANGAAASR